MDEKMSNGQIKAGLYLASVSYLYEITLLSRAVFWIYCTCPIYIRMEALWSLLIF